MSLTVRLVQNPEPILVRDWTAATPRDGAFDSGHEDFTVLARISPHDPDTERYTVSIKATAGGTTALESYDVWVDACPYCLVAP